MDIAELRSLFPVTRRYAYLNHAAMSPVAIPVRQAVKRMVTRISTHGTAGRSRLFETTEKLKRRLGSMLSVDPASLAITRNTTEGIIIAANGLTLSPGDNVVICQGEFPANVQPWRALAERGVDVRTVPEIDGRIRVDDIAARVDARTAAVALSWVEFASGFRHDLSAVAGVCRAADALFVVDAIQGLGALRLSARDADIDVLACGAHKWLLACAGIGFAYFSERALDRLRVANRGWLGVEKPEHFLDYDQPLAAGARRFETGSSDILGAAALSASVAMLAEVGFEEIERRVLELADHVDSRAREAGLEIASPRKREREKSGIVIVATPWDRPEDVARRLERGHVVVTARGPGVRVAAHAYNNEEELDRLIELLLQDKDRHS